MRKTWAVGRREFEAFVRTKTFLLGTLFGPLAIALLFALPLVFTSGGGTREIAVLDASSATLGEEVAGVLEPPGSGGHFAVRVVRPAAGTTEAERARLRAQVTSDSLDGFVLLPEDLASGAAVHYEGRNAANFGELAEIRSAVQLAVQSERLREAGIEPAALDAALAPVPFEARSLGGAEARGTPDSTFALVQLMSFATYFVVLLYGMSVLRGVQEEKEKRIVEVLLSSVTPRQLMTGKVVGIGAAGLLQVTVWVLFAAAVLTWGENLAVALGATLPELPAVPLSAGLTYLFFFTGGYFLYACLYAALGAVATSSQEAQQLQFPALMPLMIGFFMVFGVMGDPDGPLAVVGSLVPFTSPLIMPVRAIVATVPLLELIASAVLLIAGCALLLYAGGTVYRVTVLSSGTRPTMKQIWRATRSG
ncbi:MAG: ABC transporter permease [Gemmatimonadota bacterium]